MRLNLELCFLQAPLGAALPPLERELLCILGACRAGSNWPERDLEFTGKAQHVALVRAILTRFADGHRVNCRPERIAELTGIAQTDVELILHALTDADFIRTSKREAAVSSV